MNNLKGTKTYDKGLQGDDFTFILEGEIDGTLSVYIGDGVLGAAVQILD